MWYGASLNGNTKNWVVLRHIYYDYPITSADDVKTGNCIKWGSEEAIEEYINMTEERCIAYSNNEIFFVKIEDYIVGSLSDDELAEFIIRMVESAMREAKEDEISEARNQAMRSEFFGYRDMEIRI